MFIVRKPNEEQQDVIRAATKDELFNYEKTKLITQILKNKPKIIKTGNQSTKIGFIIYK